MDPIDEKAELFSHKADMGIRGIGPNFNQAFEQAGLALTQVLIDPIEIKPKVGVPISCSAPKIEVLFFDWINALIYEMAQKHFIFSQYHVTISKDPHKDLTLKGEAWGEKIDFQRHGIAVEIKGATFTELKAETKKNGACVVQCIVDV